MRGRDRARMFVLGAFDHDQWCPVLEARVVVDDVGALVGLLGVSVESDPEVRKQYRLDAAETAAVVARFGVAFDLGGLACSEVSVFLQTEAAVGGAPYLLHGGYELPLLLEGRKTLARMSALVPPGSFPGEHRFDHWVAQGRLHRVEFVDVDDGPGGDGRGFREVYYTLIGEEWRVPAMRLLGPASRGGGWNATLERLEGMLFGYSDAENDWWIEAGAATRFGGATLCCGVDAAGLAWMEGAGFRALPPVSGGLRLVSYYWGEDRELVAEFMAEGGAEALVRFNAAGAELRALIDLRGVGPWEVAEGDVAVLNRCLMGVVVVMARRGGGSGGMEGAGDGAG